MAMLPQTQAALARYDEWVARTLKSPDTLALKARRLERQGRSLGRRLWRMLLGVLSVAIAAIGIGTFVTPLGFGGIVLALFLMLFVVVVLARYPKDRVAKIEALPTADLKALPGQVESWLDGQRKALPPPAARELDRVLAQLDQLSPALARLDPASPMAEDARRLIGDHLPRLVKSYADVPATHRATPEATARLKEGLHVVGDEIGRLSETLARDSLTTLEVEGRFLESRYRGDGQVGEGASPKQGG